MFVWIPFSCSWYVVSLLLSRIHGIRVADTEALLRCAAGNIWTLGMYRRCLFALNVEEDESKLRIAMISRVLRSGWCKLDI